MKKIIFYLIPCILIFVVAGCATGGSQKLDSDRLAMIKPGETTKDQLLSWFGNPMTQTMDTEGRLSFMWHHVFVQSYPFGYSMKNQSLTVALETNGVVKQFSVLDDFKK